MTFTCSDCLGATHQEVPASKTFTCRCSKNSNFIAIYFSGIAMKNNSSRLLKSSRCMETCFLLQPTTEHLMYFGLQLEKHLWP